MAFRNYILLFALVAGTIGSPINVQDGDLKCATKCEASLSDTGKFQYAVGNTYTYAYEGTTETKLQGASQQTTSLKIQSTADIEVLSKCEFALKLRGVSLTENGQTSINSNDFKQRLEAKPLRFAFQDGVIENVCSTTGEDERVLNIKRAVLSTFQNSMTQLDKDGLFTETDVSGTCPTTYTSKSGMFGGSYTITKNKDILACVDRTGNISSIHSERYHVPSKLQNAPLLSSTHQCQQDVKSGQIQKTVCSEELMFRPFSRDGNGAMTKATQTLTYTTHTRSVSLSETAVQRRSSMLFHHLYDESTDANAKTEVIALLQEICSEVSDDIKKSTPTLFGELISKMKRLDSDKMMQVYTAVNGGRICSSLRGKQFFYDAIPVVSTEASIALTKKLIDEKIVQGTEAEMWLTQLAFIPRPTIAMLTAVMPLLNDDAHKNKAILGVSAMVHKICESMPNCHNNAKVAEFISILNANIGSDCSSTTKEGRKSILLTLKAFGNAGGAVTSSSIIGRCITNADVDTETRVAALQAFRRIPCSVSREDAMRIYENAEHDSELRIHAFLAIMTCPTTRVLTRVRMMLGGEPVNQVGSFVWTYLENLKETSSPLRQELSTILDDAKLRQDFNLDVRKFSRNLEKSFFSDYMNAGAQVESNLIWSQRSYIPRSAMLNITVEMFGDSINLVEFGGRVQGLEKIVEKFFGPNGYFSKKNVKELMDNKRQTANYLSPFDNKFKTPEDEIMTSLYIKSFGNEIAFSKMDSNDWSDLKNFNALDFLIKLAEPKKIDITKNLQIMDSSLIVPTCVGFPMNLTVNGTASISMDVDGNVDLRNIAASPRSFDINGHIKPSAAIIVSGMMGVDAIVAKSSMKMVSTMHSSTQLDGKITLQNGEIFDIELNTPQEKVEVFHVETEFFMNGQEMAMPEPALVYKRCTPAGVTRVIGMEMCVDVTLPKTHEENQPFPPFTGPMNAQIFIEKKDTHTGYKFAAKFENDKQQINGLTYTKRAVHVSLDTPGSQVDRKLLVEGIYNPAEMSVSAQVASPWKKVEWSASLINTVEQRKAQSSLVIDGDQTYSAEAQLEVSKRSVKTVWTPTLTIIIPNKPTMSITGTFETGTGRTIAAVNLGITNFTRKPITLSSSLTQLKGGSSYTYLFNVDSDMFTSSVSSTLTSQPGNYNSQTDVVYTMAGRPEHRFTIAGKYSDESRGDLMSYALQAGFIPTEFPQYMFNIDSSLDASANHIDTKLDINFNGEKIAMAHKTIKQGPWSAVILDSTSTFSYPTKNIDMSAVIKHEYNSDLLRGAATITYGANVFKSSMALDKSIADKYTAEASLSYPGRELSFSANADKIMDGEHKIIMQTKWANDANSRASLTSTWKIGETHEISGQIVIPGHPVSLSISVRPDPMNFMGRTDITYNRNTYSLKSEYKLEATKFQSSGMWSAPNSDVSYGLALSSDGGKMGVSTEFSWEPSKKITMEGEYNNLDTNRMFSREGKLTINSPFGRQFFSSEMELSSDNFARMSSELTINDMRSTMTGRYSLGSAEFVLDTPYIRYGEVKSIVAKLNHDSSHIDATVTWAPSRQLLGEIKWSNAKYSVDFTTPFSVAKVGASVELPAVNAPTIKGYWNNDEASLTASYPDMNKGEFTLTYPEHKITGSFSQSGDLTMFAGESELSFDSQKLWSKIEFHGTGPVSLSIDITTPFKVKKISANFNHDGSLTSFTNEASLTWDSQRIRSTVEFTGKTAKVSVKTPWRDVLAQYFFNGDKNSFATNALLKWADDKEVSADATFDMVDKLKASFTVNSPFYSTVTGSVEHTGDTRQFNSLASLSWTPTNTVTVTTKFSMVDGAILQVDIAAPTCTIAIAHNGERNAWTNKAELTIPNKTPMTIYSEYNQEQMNGKIGVAGMPSEKFQSGEWSVDGTAYTDKMDIVSVMAWNNNQKITASGVLQTRDGYGITASLATPFTETYSMEMTHRFTRTTLTNVASVEWAPNKKISTNVHLSTENGKEAKIDVATPWRQLSYTFNRHGNAKEFLTSTTLSWATGKQISSTLEYSEIGKLSTKWTLSTPFDMAKDVSVVVTHDGVSPQKFTSQLEASYNGQKASVGTKFAKTSASSELEIHSVNPWKDISANMKYNGNPKDFTASSALTLDGTTYSASTRFAFTDIITVGFEANTVVYRPISLSATLGLKTNTLTFRWGGDKVISATANLKMDEKLSAVETLVRFTTPFVGYKSGEITFKHTSTSQSVREIAAMSFNDQSARLVGELTFGREMKGDVTLTSPWYSCAGSFEHSGSMQQFDNSMEFTYQTGKTIRASSKWNTLNGADAEIAFSAPFKAFNAKYRHQIALSGEISGSAEVTVDRARMLTSSLTFLNIPSNINLEFSFDSPIQSFSGKYSHTGTRATRCNAEAEFIWGSDKVSAQWHVSMINGFDSAVTINSPWKNISGKVTHIGSLDNFENTISVTYETGKTITLETEFSMTPDFVIKGKLASPFKNANVLYRHSGSFKNFACYLTGAIDSLPATANLKWSSVSGYEASADLTCPWKNVKGSFKTNTDLNNLSSSANFEWGTESISSTLMFATSSGYKGAVTVNSPWTDMSAHFDFVGEPAIFDATSSFSWETGKSISATVSRTAYGGNFIFTNPFTEDMKAEFNYRDIYNFNTKLSYGASDYIADATTEWNNGLQAKIKVSSPQGSSSIDIDHQGESYDNFRNLIEFQWKDQTYKLTTSFDLDAHTIAQTLETPMVGYETLSYSSSCSFDETSFAATASAAKNTDKFEVKFESKKEQRTYKDIHTHTLEVITPFEGYERNGATNTLELSSRLFHFTSSSYVNSPSDVKKFEVYAKLTGMADMTPVLESYVKTNIFSGEQSEVNFEFSVRNDAISFLLKSHLASFPEMDAEIMSSMTRVRTGSTHSNQGSLSVTFNGVQLADYSHKTSWAVDFTVLSHEMNVKLPSTDIFKNWNLKMDASSSPTNVQGSIDVTTEGTSLFSYTSETSWAVDFTVLSHEMNVKLPSTDILKNWNLKMGASSSPTNAQGSIDVTAEGISVFSYTSKTSWNEDLTKLSIEETLKVPMSEMFNDNSFKMDYQVTSVRSDSKFTFSIGATCSRKSLASYTSNLEWNDELTRCSLEDTLNIPSTEMFKDLSFKIDYAKAISSSLTSLRRTVDVASNGESLFSFKSNINWSSDYMTWSVDEALKVPSCELLRDNTFKMEYERSMVGSGSNGHGTVEVTANGATVIKYTSNVAWTADLMKMSFDETLQIPSTEMFKDCSFTWSHEITDSLLHVDMATNGATILTSTTNVGWTAGLKKLSIEETLKVPSTEMFKDCSFTWSHDITDSRLQGSVSVTANGASILTSTTNIGWTAGLMKLSIEDTLKIPSTEMFKDCSFTWNHEITDSRLQGSVDVATNGASILTSTTDVTWSADLMRVSMEETLKMPSTDMFKDCSFNYTYEITSSGSDFNGRGSVNVASNGVSLASYTSRASWSSDFTTVSIDDTLNIPSVDMFKNVVFKIGTQKSETASGFNAESSLEITGNGAAILSYTSKTIWGQDFMKVSVDETLKVPSTEMFKDCEFKLDYDLSQAKKTFSLALFNNPAAPFDLKCEAMVGENLSAMVELATPLDMIKTFRSAVTVTRTTQPWTVKFENELNQKTMNLDGRLSYTSPAVFDFTLGVKSTIPARAVDTTLSLSSSSTQGQWKPHASFQFGADKKVDLGATISWSDQYKATMEFSSPFENWRSVSVDGALDASNVPNKLSSSVELTATSLPQKLSSQLSYDVGAQTFKAVVQSPFEPVKNFEISASMRPRLDAFIKLNGQNLLTVAGNAQFTSMAQHSLDMSITYPFLNEYIRVKVNNDLDGATDNTVKSYIDVEYMRGKEISFKFDHTLDSTKTLSVVLETPFVMLEKTSYSVAYSGSPQSWTESTTAEFYYGKVNTRTTFSMNNGFTYHQTVTGQMKNGAKDFNFQKDLIFTGDANKFDLQTNLAGSFLPTIKFETAWQYNPILLSLKSTLNDMSIEYTHTGPMNDFTCNWKLEMPSSSNGMQTRQVTGTWSFKLRDELAISADISCEHDNQVKVTFAADTMKGNLELIGRTKDNMIKYTASYARTASPFRYEGSFAIDGMQFMTDRHNHKLSSDVVLTPTAIDLAFKWDEDEIFAIRAKVPINADEEYVPTIEVVVGERTYEFDGLFKNGGEGLVRDFKLHLDGPRGMPQSTIKFQFEFRTQSSQLVPGDMKLYLATVNSETKAETKLIDMAANWGNDNALITFTAPQPMRYSLDFSVSTTGQTGTIEANWDTTKPDSNWKMDFTNKYSSTSRRLTSEIDINVVYTGISRGFVSNMDWQTLSFAHKLTFGYNGKKIGYDVNMSADTGMSVEVITEWRNVKLTWNHMTSDGLMEGTFGFYWDSARDLSKRILGSSRLEMTASNSYAWTTTVKCPYLVKDIVISDTVSYDTSRVYVEFKKNISFSPDTTKDVKFNFIVEKNGKWGIEIRQDYNNIDIRIGSEFTSAGSKSFVLYKSATGEMKTFSFASSFELAAKTLSMELVTPLKTLKVETFATPYTYTVAMTMDEKRYTSSFTLRPEDYYMLVRMSSQQSNVQLEAKQITGGYQVELSKIEGSRTTIEGLAAISINDSNTVSGKLFWNPALVSEIQTKIAAIRSALKDAAKTMSTATRREVTNKVSRMQLGNDFANIMPQHSADIESFKNDVAAAKVLFARGYDQDVFFMKSADEFTNAYVTRMLAQFAIVEAKITQFYQNVIQPRLATLGESADQAWLDLSNRLANIEEKIQDLSNRAATEWADQTELIREDVEAVAIWMQEYIDRISQYLVAHPAMTTLRSVHGAVMNQFNAASDVVYTTVVPIANPQLYTDAIYHTHTYVNNAITNSRLASSIDVSALTGLSDSLMYKVKYYYDYYDVSDNIKIFLTHSKNIAAEYLEDYLTHYIDQTLNSFKWVTYDLDAGRIQVEFVIPTTWDKLNMMELRTGLSQKMAMAIAHVKAYKLNLKEMFYMYRPVSFSQILPPFDSQAIIAGQHIRTFDKRDYDFSSGKCSYLLARDFQDGNFTIFVNYEGQEQSLTVHSNGKTIDIQQDNTIKMDGSKIELPVEFFNTTIVRMGSKVVLTSKLGVKVTCDNMHGLCTVDMSGHYFAKTGGLFGTYNYEPLDDFTTSSNTNTSDVLAFANSWTSRCTSRVNTAKAFSAIKDTKEYTACSALFKDASSPLSPCFSVVNPDSAFHKCVNDMSSDVTSTADNGPCKAVMFYQAECKFAGVPLDVPPQCVTCQVSGSSIGQGQTMQITQPVMAADIVFVVEEKMCNYDMPSKLPQLAKLIESSLSANSYSDIRFGLVGFGGERVHSPSHTHTMDSKLLAARAELSLGTAALQFSPAGSNNDVFDALDFAAQYPFRSGASKVVVVLPCSDCSESRLSKQAIAARMNSEDIAVHVINDFSYEIAVGGKNPATNFLFGIDNNAIYTYRDVRSLKGNTRLYPIVSKPTDMCSELALRTGGTVFDLNMMTKMRSNVIKNFQTVFASRLALTTTPKRCTSCSCEYNSLFMTSRTVCTKC